MNWFAKRSSEASTYSGLAAAILGFGSACKINEAPTIAETVTNIGGALLSGMNPWVAAGVGILGLFGMLKSDGDKGF